MSDTEEQIRKIKESAVASPFSDIKNSSIDTLAKYKEKGITAITEISDSSYSSEVKTHALDTIKKIKENTASYDAYVAGD